MCDNMLSNFPGLSGENNEFIRGGLMYDNILSDFPRLSGENSDSPRLQRAIDATENGILMIPKGDYEITETLHITNRCSLDMHPAARLIAKAEMDFVVEYNSNKNYHVLTLFNDDGSVYDNLGLFIRGGDIEGNGLASCLAITNAHHFTLTNTALHNGKLYGLCIGGVRGGHIYELVCNNVYCKCTMKGLAGNIGIFSDRHDSHFNDCFVIDYTVGMRILGGSNRITRCHLWGGTVPPKRISVKEWSDIYGARKTNSGVYKDTKEQYQNEVPEMLIDSIAFDIQGGYNVLDGCYADTAETGYLIGNYTRMINCDFYNNKLMGLKKSTAIKHVKGHLAVISCAFRGTVGTEILYEATTENEKTVEWVASIASGGEGMKVKFPIESATK
ncbi:MAG: hypothetical protein SOZ62_04895 [Eubacteriales bacterium]|nr:hypothetical protein [Eubacteriales bacterium]